MEHVFDKQKIIKGLFEVEKPEVNAVISPNDRMYTDNPEHYFNVGFSALTNIHLSMVSAGKTKMEIRSILDFACGHGRIFRMLKAAFPHALVTASDMDHDGVDFCSKVLGGIPAYAGKYEKPQFANRFDLIWNGSMFTHLDYDEWKDYLGYFKSVLNPGGILVFSTHGREVFRWLKDGKWNYDLEPKRIATLIKKYARGGFGYVDYSKGSNYGVSLAKPSRVFSCIEEIPGFRILTFSEKSWDNHHDIVSLIRED